MSNSLTVAFLDLENTTLKHLDLSGHAHVFMFVGARQHQIAFKSEYDHPMTVIKVQDLSGPALKRPRNNLDFHLAYYLGLYDAFFPDHVTFEVISSDRGFLPLVAHIVASGRPCIQTGAQ